MQNDDMHEPSITVPNGPPKPRTGYKAPPAAHQFKKGKSGNPRGRPKGAKGKRQIVEKVLLERHDVVEHGRKVQYTTLELILIMLRDKSFEGNTPAFKELEKIAAKYVPQLPARRAGYLGVPRRLSMNVWRAIYEDRRDPTQPKDENEE